MERPAYSFFVSWSRKDREFVATFVELPGLSGLASTIPEAIRELNDAFSAWIETAEEDGFELPKASPLPSPLIIIDRSFLGDDPIVSELSYFLPEELGSLSYDSSSASVEENKRITKTIRSAKEGDNIQI